MKRLLSSQVRCARSYNLIKKANFRTSHPKLAIKPILLADVGEGITECEIIQWFVQPGAKVNQFDKLCEIQSDKASTDITSRYAGVITKLHYEAEQIAKVGQPLAEIDAEEEQDETSADLSSAEPEQEQAHSKEQNKKSDQEKSNSSSAEKETSPRETTSHNTPNNTSNPSTRGNFKINHNTLATPAVRHLSKTLGIDIAHVNGTGKDGRVTKEDLQKFNSESDNDISNQKNSAQTSPMIKRSKQDETVPITGVRGLMFKNMTKSLAIPHVLYTTQTDFTSLTVLRRRLMEEANRKVTPLCFVIKAVSMALTEFPALNCNLNTSDSEKPVLIQKSRHDFGIAVDSPQGLVVPIIRNVQDLTIFEIAKKTKELSDSARNNKLCPSDFDGATFTISNIGSIGGATLSPVIPVPQVAILGIGRSRPLAIWDDDKNVPKRIEETIFSWTADHRVVDGATVARVAERVRKLLERVEIMMVDLK